MTKSQIVAGIFLWAFVPLLLLEAWGNASPDDPISGNWESLRPSADGYWSRIVIHHGQFSRDRVLIRKGHYKTNGRELLLSFDDNPGATPAEERIAIRFECASLVLGDSRTSEALTVYVAPSHRADAPIVGKWNSRADSLRYEFRPDGAFQREVFTPGDSERGVFQPREQGVIRVQFDTSPSRYEDWQTRIKSDHLLITSQGETIEYKQVRDFR